MTLARRRSSNFDFDMPTTTFWALYSWSSGRVIKLKLELPQRANVNLFFADFCYSHNGLSQKGGTACSLYTRWFSFVHYFQVESEFRMLVFVEGGKPEDSETKFWSKDHNKQQASLTCDTRSRNWTWASTVGGHPSYQYNILAPFFHCDIVQDYMLYIRSAPEHAK